VAATVASGRPYTESEDDDDPDDITRAHRACREAITSGSRCAGVEAFADVLRVAAEPPSPADVALWRHLARTPGTAWQTTPLSVAHGITESSQSIQVGWLVRGALAINIIYMSHSHSSTTAIYTVSNRCRRLRVRSSLLTLS
jgi:hypothetical protein